MIFRTVEVDGDALERLVRSSHTIDPLVPDGQACQCGQPFPFDESRERKAKHSRHVEYHVREALAGRIDA